MLPFSLTEVLKGHRNRFSCEGFSQVIVALRATVLTIRASLLATRHTRPMSKPGMKQGRQMATIFAEMLKDCPGEVGVYGQCASGGLPASMEHRNCDKEFASMRKCFQRVRTKTRLKPR